MNTKDTGIGAGVGAVLTGVLYWAFAPNTRKSKKKSEETRAEIAEIKAFIKMPEEKEKPQKVAAASK